MSETDMPCRGFRRWERRAVAARGSDPPFAQGIRSAMSNSDPDPDATRWESGRGGRERGGGSGRKRFVPVLAACRSAHRETTHESTHSPHNSHQTCGALLLLSRCFCSPHG
eukprot:2115889-Rhodomonas_salina.2